tara:strand:- start:694 stop:2154 length:1461 start_codon:yes stop_codon:yes gene_type:complete
VYPKYPNTFWSFKYALSFINKKAAFPPLGLMTVSSMLPEKWNRRLIDLNVEPLLDEQIAWADMVMISAMIVQKDSAIKVIKRCNDLGTKVVAGGPVFTTKFQDFKGVDHFILNEGEVTLPQFIKDVEQGTLKKLYTSGEKPDITNTPIPDWSLINMKEYSSMAIQYSRGCPFNCEFCDIIVMNGRVPRTKTPEQLVSEMQSLLDAKWNGPVFVVDDNFIGNRGTVKKMLPTLIQWQKENKYPFPLITEASTNLADDEQLMQLMSAANFYQVFLGIETPNLDSLKECAKVQNLKGSLIENVKKIQSHGMQVLAGFIVGFDSDTENIFQNQIDFIQEVGVVTAMVGILSALPKTRLWHRLKDEGRLLEDATGENTDGTINFVPKMSKKKLIEGYHTILKSIYNRKQYYKRINTLLKTYNPTVKMKLTKDDVMAFFKSIWKIGIISNSRFQYWKLMTKTFLTKRKSLPVAVSLAIWGIHFEKIMKKMTA